MVSLTEEAILNENFPKGLRRYRIEYGFECSCPEGVIYLPEHLDADLIEDFLNSLFDYKCNCWPADKEKV